MSLELGQIYFRHLCIHWFAIIGHDSQLNASTLSRSLSTSSVFILSPPQLTIDGPTIDTPLSLSVISWMKSVLEINTWSLYTMALYFIPWIMYLANSLSAKPVLYSKHAYPDASGINTVYRGYFDFDESIYLPATLYLFNT